MTITESMAVIFQKLANSEAMMARACDKRLRHLLPYEPWEHDLQWCRIHQENSSRLYLIARWLLRIEESNESRFLINWAIAWMGARSLNTRDMSVLLRLTGQL